MTPERIHRDDDERLYQPRIHSRWIRELYRIKRFSGEPMTVLVDWALQEFVQSRMLGDDRDSDGLGSEENGSLPHSRGPRKTGPLS